MRKPPLRNARQNAAYPVSLHGYYSARSDDGSAILEGDESFADLFAASLNSPRKAVARRDPELGDLVQGEIVQIGAEFAFLDIGGKSEGVIPANEFIDIGELQIGSTIEVMVERQQRAKLLSQEGARVLGDWQAVVHPPRARQVEATRRARSKRADDRLGPSDS